MPSRQTGASDDFNPKEVAKSVGQHDEDIADVKKRLEVIENKFGTNEKIADTLCETADKASRMDEMLQKRFLKLLQHDVDIKSGVTDLVNKIDRDFFKSNMKRGGLWILGAVWSVALIVIGILLGRAFGGK